MDNNIIAIKDCQTVYAGVGRDESDLMCGIAPVSVFK